MADNSFVPFPDIEIVVADGTLPLEAVEGFSLNYPSMTGASVRLSLRWGGPAVGGPGWGGPEIAVLVVMGELLRRGASDVYDLLRAFVIDSYSRIQTRKATRWYVEGALALAIDSQDRSLRLLFCLPEGLDKETLQARIKSVEEQYENVLAEWLLKRGAEPRDGRPIAEVRLCWNDRAKGWVECQPAPEGQRP